MPCLPSIISSLPVALLSTWCPTCRAMTCGCIDFVAKPMYEAMAVLLPHMHDEVFANVTLNRSLWNAFSTNGRRASEASLLPYFVLVFSKPNLISKDCVLKVLGTLFYSSVSLSFFVFLVFLLFFLSS
jgi:hypothetical protein